METGMPGSANALVRISSVAAQIEKRMDIQAPLTAVYFHAVPALAAQPSAAAREHTTLHLPSLYSKDALPLLTLHVAGGLQSQPGLSLATAAPAARPKSAGKHVCPHCGRDCMKPSVLEKHLRCHTGERPYPCTTCGVSFKTQSNLYKHKRTQAHARLSSESEQSSLGSLDSMSSSRETCTSSLSLDECGMEKQAALSAENTFQTSAAKVCSVETQGSVAEPKELCPEGHNSEPNGSATVTIKGEKQTMENEKPALTASRHLPLQRQEATLFSKQWESSVSRGKSQSHESTDSGFSESTDHYPSPGSVLPDHNTIDSHVKSTVGHPEENASTQTSSEPGQGGQEPKDMAREQEQKTLEERISKLISENTAVVEDKQLENIRPRKTVLSKQGSIDLPMPYTYKDSFHFDMRISKNVGLQRKAGFYSSVPTQHSTTAEHAPLIRSNSLPFSVTLLQPERSHPAPSYLSDNVALARRGSSGQINPTGFAMKPVSQQSTTHRPLVRQAAVDCNHATDVPINSSVEEAYAGSLSCDGDICGEPNNRKLRRKKAQKFAYNKWYMYGGGTFKKLYSAEKTGDDGVIKGRKCSTNPKQELVQGLQKSLSAIQKETVTATDSPTDFTSSSATGCHTGCPPAKPPTSQPYTSCSSLETPHWRNLSLSTLPLPFTGPLVSHKKDNMSRTEAGELIHEKEHTDSSPQLHGTHIPSDRKKQKTDDKLMCHLEMETDPNTLTHPPPSVTGRTLQQDIHLSYINLQKNEEHTPLKAALFPPSAINANASSVRTSPSSFTPAFTKTSFLPKYQLKLPNAAESDSTKCSVRDVNKPTVTDCRSFLSSPYVEQTSLSATAPEKKCPVISPAMQSCDIKKTSAACSFEQSQPLLPRAATTLCQTETSTLNKNATFSLAVVRRQFASTTKTTTCQWDVSAGLCSSSIWPTESAGGSASVHLPRPVTPEAVPATPTITPANNHTSATAFSQVQPNPPLSHMQLSRASDKLSPVNGAYAGPNTPIVSCHVVPFDQLQPATQNVFHVHTADLQICLQIISDEQLALIEPQIERQAGSTPLSRCDMKTPEVMENKAQSSISTGCSDEGMDHQQPGHHGEMDESECSPTVHMDCIKLPLSVKFGKTMSDLHLTDSSDSTQATAAAESKLPDALGSPRQPQNCGQIDAVTERWSSTADVMSTSPPIKGVMSGRSQTSVGDRALSLNCCAEEQHLPDKSVSQGGLMPQMLSGQRNLNSSESEILSTESQHSLKILRTLCNIGTIKAISEASANTGSRLQSGETHSPLQAGLGQASGAVSADELSGSAVSFSVQTPRQLNPHACIYCSNPVESTSPQALKSSTHVNMGCDRLGLLEDPAPSQEMSECDSQDVISPTHSEKQVGPFTSVSSNIQVEEPPPAVLSSLQSPAGLPEGASLAGCAVQKEPQTQGHEEISKQSQETGGPNHQCLTGRGGGGVAGENEHKGDKTDGTPGHRGKAEPNCIYTCLPDNQTKPQGEDRKTEADSFKNSALYEQHLSQIHSGMSELPPPTLQQATSMSDNLHSPARNSQTSLLSSPHPPLEINNFYLSQQHWESSSIHNQPWESNSSYHIKAQVQLTETQNAFSQVESSPQQTQQTFSQDQKQTGVTLSVQQGNTTAGNNITAVSCCPKLTSGSHVNTLPDIRTSSSTHPSHMSYSIDVSGATAGLTVDTQRSNNNALDNNTVLPSKPFTYPESDDYQDTKDTALSDYTSQSFTSGRSDITNKYQSFLFAGPLHGYQTAECVTSGVRPVQSCHDYTEDTSSSDDEGKLIIEL